MRDRQTDSWWSIMSSTAIGGALDGADLRELPVSEKVRWGAWRAKHPETRVLSVDGVEHVANNPYDNYLTGDSTFRDLGVDDDRLAPKAPIFAFWWDGEPMAAPFDLIENGWVHVDGERALVLHRAEGASIFASTRVVVVPAAAAGEASATELLDRVDTGSLQPSEEGVSGFDTYWYTWVNVNPGTRVLGR